MKIKIEIEKRIKSKSTSKIKTQASQLGGRGEWVQSYRQVVGALRPG